MCAEFLGRERERIAEVSLDMASSKVMASSNSKNSDLSRRISATKPSQPVSDHRPPSNCVSTMTADGFLRNVYTSNPPSSGSTLLDAQITLMEAPIAATPPTVNISGAAADTNTSSSSHRAIDDVWRELVSGDRKEMKEEAPDEMMTLEDFLPKAGAVEEEEVKMLPAERLSGGVFAFDPIPPSPFQQLDKVDGSIVGFGNGMETIGMGGARGKRGRAAIMEPMDKAAQQRQRRMIKNRESAARSRERKQVKDYRICMIFPSF